MSIREYNKGSQTDLFFEFPPAALCEEDPGEGILTMAKMTAYPPHKDVQV